MTQCRHREAETICESLNSRTCECYYSPIKSREEEEKRPEGEHTYILCIYAPAHLKNVNIKYDFGHLLCSGIEACV